MKDIRESDYTEEERMREDAPSSFDGDRVWRNRADGKILSNRSRRYLYAGQVWANEALESIRLLPGSDRGLRFQDTEILAAGLWFFYYFYLEPRLGVDRFQIVIESEALHPTRINLSVGVDIFISDHDSSQLARDLLSLLDDVDNSDGWLSVGEMIHGIRHENLVSGLNFRKVDNTMLFWFRDSLTDDLARRLAGDASSSKMSKSHGRYRYVMEALEAWTRQEKIERMANLISGSFS